MKTTNRREFLQVLGTAAGWAGTSAAQASGTTTGPGNGELGMLYDATRCVGCKACMAVCKRVNGDYGSLAYEPAPFDHDALWDAPQDLSGDTRTIVKVGRQDGRSSFVKHSCMHCQKPSCVSVCPVSAMTKDKATGIVDYSKNICIGCRYCQIACAFNIPKFQWDRTLPQIVKCDLCRNTNLREKGVPACAEACPTQAILFGKRGDLLGEAKARIEKHPDRYVPRVYGESEVGGTNHLYLAAISFAALGLPDLPSEPPASFAEKIQHSIYQGFVAPVSLYGLLAAIMVFNLKRRSGPTAPAPSSANPGH